MYKFCLITSPIYRTRSIIVLNLVKKMGLEVGIETGKIIKNERKEKNLRNSYFGHGHAENFRCPRIRPA